MNLENVPVAETAMLIRAPAAQVYEAFVDPAITSKFWFTKGSGRLDENTHVRWDWEMYGVSSDITVRAIEPNERIVIEWSSYGTPTTVEWTFASRPDNTTFVTITDSGFQGTGDEIVRNALGSVNGFTLVLAGLKAWLEHHLILNLVPDRFPDQMLKP